MNIIDLFDKEQLTEKADGNFKVTCPSCASSGSFDYGGMILFVESNTAYCHQSKTWFNMKETFALIKGIIQCIDGRTKE